MKLSFITAKIRNSRSQINNCIASIAIDQISIGRNMAPMQDIEFLENFKDKTKPITISLQILQNGFSALVNHSKKSRAWISAFFSLRSYNSYITTNHYAPSRYQIARSFIIINLWHLLINYHYHISIEVVRNSNVST